MADKEETAKKVRIRIEAARQHLTDALREVSVPDPDLVACQAHIDMATDVMPVIEGGEVL